MVEGSQHELSSRAIEEIDGASRRGEILVSAISRVGARYVGGEGEDQLFAARGGTGAERSTGPGVRLLPLTPEIAIESTRLPGLAHGDPADRMLIASARVLGGRLATRDRTILDYAGAGHLTVVDASP